MVSDYAWEKSYSAARSMALMDASLLDRVRSAWASNISLLEPDGDFPDEAELQRRYALILERMSGAEGPRPLDSLEELELHAVAEAIFDFYTAVQEATTRREVTAELSRQNREG